MDLAKSYNDLEKLCNEFDDIRLPELPPIPEIVLCLHFPGSDGWRQHWIEFHKKARDFHRSMIDFNCRLMNWYILKSKQLQRFGRKSDFIVGSYIVGPSVTLIYARPIFEADVLIEVRKSLPYPLAEDVRNLERTGYKLLLPGKVFLFNKEKVVCIDTDESHDGRVSKFSLYFQNTKLDMVELANRAYGGLINSFLIGGIGGILSSYLTGYFRRPREIYSRNAEPEKSLLSSLLCRFLACASSFSFLERVLLIKYSHPEKYLISGSAGSICGFIFSFSNNCNSREIAVGSASFCIFALISTIFSGRHWSTGRSVGEN